MYLVLCSLEDREAHWAYRELRAVGLDPLRAVSDMALAMPTELEHRVGTDETWCRLQLADGLVLSSAGLDGVLNRITSVPAMHVLSALPPDRDYAMQELHALYLSWLAGLPCPVLNRPTPLGLCGPLLQRSAWMRLAAETGLETSGCEVGDAALGNPATELNGWSHGEPVTVHVVQGSVVGDSLPVPVRTGCEALARRADVDLLGVRLSRSGGQWRFVDASPMPDLQCGGPQLISAVVQALTSGVQGGAR
jgi:hypothetical protein